VESTLLAGGKSKKKDGYLGDPQGCTKPWAVVKKTYKKHFPPPMFFILLFYI
jgi:hypothetical protein